MVFTISSCIEILERTPTALESMLGGLSPFWTGGNEGPDTWSVHDVIGHLIHGEKTDWIARLRIILSDREPRAFEPFDRSAHLGANVGRALEDLLDEFRSLRNSNLSILRDYRITPAMHERTGVHPALGPVTLSQLLATWAVHDLDHLSQIARVMAKQYYHDVGPWAEYLKILKA